MKKISRRNVTSELFFESDDGTRFSFEGQAIERDLELAEKDIEPLKKGDINIPAFNLIGNIYKISTGNDLALIERYCDLRDFELSIDALPSLIIITDDYVVSVDKLKELSKEVGNL